MHLDLLATNPEALTHLKRAEGYPQADRLARGALGAPTVRTAVAVTNPKNTGRVMRAHADVVLNLPMIGSDLLAMALSGEEIKADALVGQLLKLG